MRNIIKMEWKHWSLAVAIAILFSIFVNVGIETFYPGPNFDRDFKPLDCPDYNRPKMTTSGEPQEIEYRPDCNEWEQKEFKSAKEVYERNVFIILLIAGIIGIVLGIIITAKSVAAGLLYGGILTLLIAVIRYWENLQSVGKFVVSGVALAILIYIGYKKLK